MIKIDIEFSLADWLVFVSKVKTSCNSGLSADVGHKQAPNKEKR